MLRATDASQTVTTGQTKFLRVGRVDTTLQMKEIWSEEELQSALVFYMLSKQTSIDISKQDLKYVWESSPVLKSNVLLVHHQTIASRPFNVWCLQTLYYRIL